MDEDASVIRLLLVHDTTLMRSALAALLGVERDLDVLTAPWRYALGLARDWKAQVFVVDGDCRGSDLPDTATQLADPTMTGERPLLLLARQGRPGLLRRASQANVLGYVNKDSSPERLLAGIRRVAAGERYVDESLASDFLRAADMPLTCRELTVLSAAAEGASVAEIAKSLHLSGGTVRNYLAAVIRKTGARNRVDAIRIARGSGWI